MNIVIVGVSESMLRVKQELGGTKAYGQTSEKEKSVINNHLSTYDFSTLYTTLPYNLIKDKLVDLIERTFQREGSLYIACNDKNAFSHLM